MYAQTESNSFGNPKFDQSFSQIFGDMNREEKPVYIPQNSVFEVAPCGTIRIVEKD